MKLGLVESLAQPGGNIIGLSLFYPERRRLLHGATAEIEAATDKVSEVAGG